MEPDGGTNNESGGRGEAAEVGVEGMLSLRLDNRGTSVRLHVSDALDEIAGGRYGGLGE